MSDTRTERLAALCAEQRERWRAGQRVLVEEFLARYPALETDEAGLVDLIIGEIQLRQRLGESPTHDEYLRRFPHFHAHLSGCFVLPQRHSPNTMAPGSTPTHFPPPAAARPSPSISDVAILASMPPSEDGGPSPDTGTDGVGRTQTIEGGSNPFESTGLREALGDAAQDGGLGATVSGVAHVAPPAPRRFPSPPGYVVLAELGKGGMGVVYKAWETRLRREVALKVALVRPQGGGTGATELGRFRKEAEAMARLHHPNIVQVYHVGEHEGVPYFALEYIEGQSLDQKLRLASLTAPEAARIVKTLALAAEHAHSMGVVHRDLKPANVLMGSTGAIKLTDFGLAKRLDEVSLTKTGELMGTPCYMAPEQAEGRTREIGPAVDVYALGAILYECLTGRPPFKEATTPLTILAVLQIDPVPPRQVQPAVPRDLETICLKCLEKDPKKRYPSAAALAEDLDRFLDNRTIMARRSTMPERAWKWARRRPAIAALTALSLVTLLLGTAIVMLSLQRKAEHAEIALERYQKTEHARDEVQSLLAQAEGHLAREDWQPAHDAAEAALTRIDTEPEELEYLRGRASALKKQADTELQKRQQQMTYTARKEKARQKLQDFRKLRNDALFFASQSNGLDAAVNLTSAARVAREALDVLTAHAGQEGPSEAVQFLDVLDVLPREERDQAHADVYELLLVLAEAVARPPAAGMPAGGRDAEITRLDHALRLLRRAQSLGLKTLALIQQRADYLARLGQKQPAEQQRLEAERLQAQLEKQGPAEDRRLSPQGRRERAADYFLLGSTAYQQQRLAQAVLPLEAAVRLRPEHFWAHYFLAQCYLRRGDAAQVQAHLSICLSQRKDYVWPYVYRGVAHTLLGDHAKRLQPPRLGEAAFHFQAADEDFQNAAQLDRDDTARYVLLCQRGLLAFFRNDDSEAITRLKEATPLAPKQFEAHDLLADVYSRRKPAQRWLVDAKAELDKAIKLRPDLPNLYRKRAQVLLNLDRAAEAADDLAKAIQRRKAPAELLNGGIGALVDDLIGRGRALQAAQKFSPAVDAYEEALAVTDLLERLPGGQRLGLVDANVVDAKLRRAYCLLRCARDPRGAKNQKALYQEAVVAYDYALESPLARTRPDAYQGAAHARAGSGDYAGARDDCSVALALAPTASKNLRAGLHAERGWIYLDGYDAPRLALEDFEKMLTLKGDDPRALAGRGIAHARLGQVREAIADAEKVIPRARQLVGKREAEGRRLLAEVARIYARSAVANTDQQARCESDAIAALREALKDLSATSKRTLWQEAVLGHKADFALLQTNPRFHDLAPPLP